MSAGVYLDRGLRDLVLARIRLDTRRRVAPSYGHDIVPVAVHAGRSLYIDLAAQAATVGLIVHFCPNADLTAALVVLLADVSWPRPRPRDTSPEAEDIRRSRTKFVRLLWIGALVYAAVRIYRDRDLTPAALVVPGLTCVGGIMLVAAVAALLRRALAHCASVREPATGPWPGRLGRIDAQQHDGLVLYRRASAKNDPGVARRRVSEVHLGAGLIVHHWGYPLTVPLLSPGERGGTAPTAAAASRHEHVMTPFEVEDCIDALARAVREVGDADEPGALPHLVIRDRVFAEEKSAVGSLPPMPLEGAARTAVINEPHGNFRHVLEITTTATGDIVTTVFVRVTLIARTLNLDFTACALTPLPALYEKPEYQRSLVALPLAAAKAALRWPDEMASGFSSAVLWAAAKALPHALLSRALIRGGAEAGTTISAREHVAEPWSATSEAAREIARNVWVVQERLLRSMVSFLDDHGVDVSQFERWANLIIAANVLNMGDGSITFNNTPTAQGGPAPGTGADGGKGGTR
ncbi:hypothetical protein GCM10022221_71140 [Actinocorallia aurea]